MQPSNHLQIAAFIREYNMFKVLDTLSSALFPLLSLISFQNILYISLQTEKATNDTWTEAEPSGINSPLPADAFDLDLEIISCHGGALFLKYSV